ncbi:MAG: nucleotidyltransferase [Deltaproteobacteria bacterium]|nr:nucleotidyltransferase [Deltaproteobacteria bacterium]
MIEVDVFIEHPIDFEMLVARSVVVEVHGLGLRIASIEDLIALKQLADRPQDREDIRALEAIARQKGGVVS